MELPFFYIDSFDESQSELLLNEDTSKHIVQVLRMRAGEQLHMTDGKGNILLCSIIKDNKKACLVKVESKTFKQAVFPIVTIAISLLKNTNRFEWFLEKATEIGVSEIIPLLCERTEKEKFRQERLIGICISAMLQSQQVWLPVLHEPKQFGNLKMWKCENGPNFIAHCNDGVKQPLSDFHSRWQSGSKFSHSLICIGPEGDFSNKEIELALENQFIPVILGSNRLRSETAGIVASAILLA